MKIKKINMVSYGKFENKELEFSDGFNIISGNNESGKSTILSFIRAMFYGFSGRGSIPANDRKHYLPWGKTTLSGSADILLDNGKTVKLSRTSGKSQGFDKAECFDVSNTDEYNFNPETEIGCGEDAFLKTLCIKQLQSNFSGEDDEISKKLINLTHSASEDINAQETLEVISKYIKNFKAARGNGGSISKIQEEISDINLKLSSAEQKRIESFDAIKEKRLLAEEIENVKKELTSVKNKLSVAKMSEIFTRIDLVQSKKITAETKLLSLSQREKEISDMLSSMSVYENEPPEIIFTAQENTALCTEQKETIQNKIKSEKTKILILSGLGLLSLCLSFANILFVAGFIIFGGLSLFSVIKSKGFKAELEKLLTEIKNKESVNNEITDALKLYGVNDFRSYSEKKAQYVSLKTEYENIIKSVSGIKSELAEFESELSALNEKTSGIERTESTYTAEELAEEEVALDSLLKSYIEKSARIEGALSAAGSDEESCEVLAARKAELIKELDNMIAEHQAAQTAFDILSEVFSEIRSDFTPLVNEKASEYLKTLTDGSLDKIYLDKKFSVTAEKEGVHELAYFSLGTFDQTYLSIRLAMIDLLFGKNKPIFIDDSFVQYDSEREKRAFELLAKRAKEGQQIIFFTCRPIPDFDGEYTIINLTI